MAAALAALALTAPAGALANPLDEESLTCELHAGMIRFSSSWDGGPGWLLGGWGDEALTASGTCVVPGSDPSNPAVYDAYITDSGGLTNSICGSDFIVDAWPSIGGGVWIQLYDASGAWSPESASGRWSVGYSMGIGRVSAAGFRDGEGDVRGEGFGTFAVRTLDRVDCVANSWQTGRGWRRLTIDGTFTIEYGVAT